jgi:hypothetical protein
MNQTVASILMMNNYFHDVATATIIALGIVVWILLGCIEQPDDVYGVKFFLTLYGGLRKVLFICLLWLVVGGVPRILTFNIFEMAEAAEKGLLAALLTKHVLAFGLIFLGALFWIKLGKRIKSLEEQE